MPPKRIVLFCEGQGEVQALPALVEKFLAQLDPVARQKIFCDPNPFRIGDLTTLVNKGSMERWANLVKAAAMRKHVGAMLLVLDGDHDLVKFPTLQGQRLFCAAEFATLLARQARAVGAGRDFSLAVVFVRQEFESWLIAGCPEFQAHAPKNPTDIESNKGAKGWIERHRRATYKPTRDQAELTATLDIHAPLLNQMRSFQRLKNAMSQLVQAVCENQPVCTPDIKISTGVK